MVRAVFSIVVNIVYFIVLNMDLYTDRAMMADGTVREWQRSPVSRLYIADRPVFLYLQIIFSAVSIISSVLLLFGVRNSTVDKIQLISAIAATVMFIIIMIITGNSHAHYA